MQWQVKESDLDSDYLGYASLLIASETNPVVFTFFRQHECFISKTFIRKGTIKIKINRT